MMLPSQTFISSASKQRWLISDALWLNGHQYIIKKQFRFLQWRQTDEAPKLNQYFARMALQSVCISSCRRTLSSIVMHLILSHLPEYQTKSILKALREIYEASLGIPWKWCHVRILDSWCILFIAYILRQNTIPIDDSPYYVFVALCACIVVIVVSLIKIAASNENIECFRE
jgi:hypothetical protein